MVRIGKSEIDIAPLNLGGNVFGWTADKETSFAILDAFVEGGGNFIDSADVYSAWVDGNAGGESESIIGEWIAARGNRDRVVVATKVGSLATRPGASAANIAAAVDESLQRLRSEYIDLYYIHMDDPDTPLEETLEALNTLVTAGKVRTIGASNFSPERLAEALALSDRQGWARFDALQPPYSLVNRQVFEGPLEKIAVDEAVSVFTYSSLGSGFLSGKYRKDGGHVKSPRAAGAGRYLEGNGEHILAALADIAASHGAEMSSVALAWVRQRPSVTAPIASAGVVDQVPALLASIDLILTDDEMAQLDLVSATVTQV